MSVYSGTKFAVRAISEMIAKMVEVVGVDEGLYRNVWPPAIETLIKQIQERAWTLRSAAPS